MYAVNSSATQDLLPYRRTDAVVPTLPYWIAVPQGAELKDYGRALMEFKHVYGRMLNPASGGQED